MSDKERWVPIEGFPDYSVNPLGQVRRDSSKRVFMPRLNQYNVPYVGLMRDGRQCIRSLLKIVAEAFVPRPDNPRFDTPLQMDGDPLNCRADNIVWRPRWYAVRYKHQFADPYDHPINASIRVAGEDGVYRNSLAAGCAFGVLEREVVMSVLNNTLAWPTYQKFELVNPR